MITDWLKQAKERDQATSFNETDGPTIAAALIAIAEELHKINEREAVVSAPAVFGRTWHDDADCPEGGCDHCRQDPDQGDAPEWTI